jgi:hypothetical protein
LIVMNFEHAINFSYFFHLLWTRYG